jgi:hypothetical protein
MSIKLIKTKSPTYIISNNYTRHILKKIKIRSLEVIFDKTTKEMQI